MRPLPPAQRPSWPACPSAYGTRRIIGDYRTVALYGVESPHPAQAGGEESELDTAHFRRRIVRDREKLAEQIRALQELQSEPRSTLRRDPASRTAREAVQWLYFGYLGALKEQNSAAMSLGRTSTFLDIYFERDLAAAPDRDRHRRSSTTSSSSSHRPLPAHAGVRRPVRRRSNWVTESIGGMGDDGRRWSRRPASDSCRRSTTSGRRRSRT